MNKIEKLEMDYISPFLPYEVKCKISFKDGHSKIKTLKAIVNDGYKKDSDYPYHLRFGISNYDIVFLPPKMVKPLLLPLTALSELLINGGIPIVELAKIAESQHFSEPCKFEYNKEANVSLCGFNSKETGEFIIFSYIHDQNAFYLRSEKRGDALVMVNQIKLFQYLFKNHFDVFGLIDAGLAIDKRTA